MADLQISNVTKQYNDDDTVVKDFNLSVLDGEFIVLVGPSGCGKSTMLKMIAGIEDISHGEIFLNDKKLNHIPSKSRNVAMVFQNYALYPHMTVFDNIAFNLKMGRKSKSEIQQRVERTAEILGLTEYLHRKPDALSGGQKQRVALGRAVVRESDLYLMDEPLSNLDAKLRVNMRTEIIKLHRRLKTTTLYVTHDQTEAMTMASRIAVMDHGEIIQIGSPKEVYNLPETLFVASFIGSPGINVFTCVFDGEKLLIGNEPVDVTAEDQVMLQEEGYTGKMINLGIRPEDVLVSSKDDSASFEGEVKVSELLGSELMLYAEFEGFEVTAKVDAGNQNEPGDNMNFTFNMSKAHFFDGETRKRIRTKA